MAQQIAANKEINFSMKEQHVCLFKRRNAQQMLSCKIFLNNCEKIINVKIAHISYIFKIKTGNDSKVVKLNRIRSNIYS